MSRSSLLRNILAGALAAASLLAAARPATAQSLPLEPAVQLSSADILRQRTDSAQRADSAAHEKSSRTLGPTPTRLFYGALIVGTALTFQYSVDPDEGGYEDDWNTMAAFPDKAVHALAGWALTGIGVDLGARPWMAAASVCAAGAAFEYSQGYVSTIDIAADCVGAAGAALWRTWRKKVDRENGR